MADTAAGTLAQLFCPSLIEAAKEKIKYVREYKTFVKNLRDGLKDLEGVIKQVLHAVDEASYNAEIIEDEVNTWIDEAKDAIKQARDLLEENDKSKKSCFLGILPNPSTRFQISKKAEAIIGRVKQLKDKRAEFGQRISYRSAPIGRVTGSYTGANYHVTKSRENLLKEINKALLDSNVRIVGVSGRSGVGKSVLMKQVEMQVSEKRLGYDFEQVTMVAVGQAPNLEKIQDDIAYRLRLKFENENGVEHKAHRLGERLKEKKKTLMIFDDLWKKLELDKLGIPQGNEHSHIKILLTSRSKEMLMNDMNSKPNLTLEPLGKEEALELFETLVGQPIKDESKKEVLQKQLVEGCAGLPLFIVPLATKLKRLPLSEWKNDLQNLKRSDSVGMKIFVEETLGDKHHVIQADDVKALFLLCGQIGSPIISIEDLLIYGKGIGFLKGDTIEESRERLQTLLKSLMSNGLLEEVKNNLIKIHDLVSDVSLSIAKAEHHSLVLRNKESLDNCLDEELKQCKSISFPNADDIHKLLEGLICPELNMFLLYTENCPLNLLDSFFSGTRKLKVMNLSGIILTVLPSSIELLDELHSLCLDRCKIEDLKNIGKLKQLKMLTFRGSDISRLPKEIGELIDLRLLNLEGCHRLQVIEPDVLGSLIHLEELILPNSFNGWEAEGVTNASLNELNNMSCLSSLQIYIPNVEALPHDIPFGNLKRYKIFIGDQSDFFMEYDEERELVLMLNSDDTKIIWEDWVQTTLQRTQKISLLGWRGIEESVVELSKGGFLELRHIDLQYSPRIQYIFHPIEQFQFSLVESLYLYRLINLEKIYQGSLTTDSFTNLKSIRITACHNLRNLFSISLAKELSRIEEIMIANCKMISEIITFDSVDDSLEHKGGTTDNKPVRMKFNRLRTLKLSGLPKILSFCATVKENRTTSRNDDSSQIEFLNGQQVSFPCLESLTLSKLPLLEKICHSKYPVRLHRLRSLKVEACKKLSNAVDSKLLLQLKSLEELTIKNCASMKTVFDLDKLTINEATKSVKQLQVSGCEELKYLFSSSMAKLLQDITYISISDCKTMEKVFVEEKRDGDDTRDNVVFSSLTVLSISVMESLTMFASGNRCLEFPCLKQIEVRDCPMMSTFVPSKSEKKFSRIGTFSKNEKRLLRTTTTQDVDGLRDKSFFGAKAILPRLEKLVLSSIESLRNMWEMSLPKDSFYGLASIEIKDCDKLQTMFPLALMERLQNLTKLEVYNCKALEVLFESSERGLMISKLKDMSLHQLPKLKQLAMIKSSSRKAVLGFPNLTNIHIDECHGLVELFSNATARTLFGLENLEITSCSSMVGVFSAVAEDEELASFRKLCSLKLKNLANLISFCTRHGKHYFPFLKELSIIRCTKLKAFVQKPPNPAFNEDDSTPLFDDKVVFPNLQKLQIEGLNLNEIWHNKLPARVFCKLKFLEVKDCNKLLVLIPSFMMNNLQSLDSLTVTKCNSLEVIFELEGHTSKDHKLAKSRSWKLKSMMLFYLPNLKCICKSAFFSKNFLFHELVSLEVSFCKSMEKVIETRKDDHTEGCKKIIFFHLSSLKLLNLPTLITFCAKHTTEWPVLQWLEIRDCNAVEALVADSEQHFIPLFLLEKVAFPKIKSLTVSKMSNLKDLWCTSKEGKDSECSSDAFCNLKTLEIYDCNRLSTIFSSKVIRGFQNLEELSVQDCSSLEQVFQVQGNRVDSNDNVEVISIDFSLRMLHLSNLPTMKQIWTIENPEGIKLSFEKLASVTIESCDSLRHLFPASVAKYLHQLKRVQVSSCNKMEEIVSRESNSTKDYVDGSVNKKFISFPKATYLRLEKLPELKIILYGVHSSEWPSLEEFEAFQCPNVKILAAEMWNTTKDSDNGNKFDNLSDAQVHPVDKENISSLKSIATDMSGLEDGRFPDDFVNLKKIRLTKIEDEEAVKRFPWNMLLEKIHNIEVLEIRESSFEELFPLVDEEAHGHAEGKEEEKEIVQLKSGGLTGNGRQKHALGTLKIQSLRALYLYELRKLKHVWKQDSIMADILNKVEILTIWSCNSLTILFPTSASFLNLTKLAIDYCDGMVHLVTASAARCMVQLTLLIIDSCDSMKHIVIEDEDGNGIEGINVGAGSGISFPRLKVLLLNELDKLESFSSTTCHFNFPSLESVNLFSLPALEDFCKGGFTAPMLHDVSTGRLVHEVNLV